jgi:hypothetical protein
MKFLSKCFYFENIVVKVVRIQYDSTYFHGFVNQSRLWHTICDNIVINYVSYHLVYDRNF